MEQKNVVSQSMKWLKRVRDVMIMGIAASILLSFTGASLIAAGVEKEYGKHYHSLFKTEEEVSIPEEAVVVDGHSYYLYEDGMTWPEAEELCESMGGHLVCINSEDEQEVVLSMLVNGIKNAYWIGGHIVDDEWVWVTGEDSEYSNWASNQPDNYKDVEDSLMIYNNYNPKSRCEIGQWNDLCYDGTCQGEEFFGLENMGFICEWEMAPEGRDNTDTILPPESDDSGICEAVYHTVNSDSDNKYYFYFNEGEELEDMLRSVYSKNYNPRMAHFLGVMARSAYDQDLVKNNYEILGFNCEQWFYDNDQVAACSFGEKILPDGSSIVLITIRGTGAAAEWLIDFDLGGALGMDEGVHSGFSSCEDKIYSCIEDYFGGNIKTDKVKYVITGHSLGAATGNLLAKHLYKEGVSPYCIFDYNFGCPNVALGPKDSSYWNDRGELNFIINVGNWCDLVTHAPGWWLESSDKPDSKWKRFGKSFWFDNGFQWVLPAHDMATYLEYLQKELDSTHFRDREFVGLEMTGE